MSFLCDMEGNFIKTKSSFLAKTNKHLFIFYQRKCKEKTEIIEVVLLKMATTKNRRPFKQPYIS